MSHPLISVCIPVYNAEAFLYRCLESVAGQSFADWEIVIVNDGSSGKDQKGQSCRKIVKSFIKAHKLKKDRLIYLEHSKNLGLLEARRSLILNARADYITMLDSDDSLLPGALQAFYEAAQQSSAEIIQAGAEIELQTTDNEEINKMNQQRAREMQKAVNNIYDGRLTNEEIFNGFLCQHNHSGFLWGKLISRNLYKRALDLIPFSKCVFAEDILQYFLISYLAKKYYGFTSPLYRYRVDTGISSPKKISSLSQWEQICSTANVFTILFSLVKEFNPALNLEQMEGLRSFSRHYISNNLHQLKESVIPELQEEARALLCDYWGQDFVELADKHL